MTSVHNLIFNFVFHSLSPGKKPEDGRLKKKNESHLMDLLDISFGATSIASPPPPTSNDAWGGLGASSSAMGGGGNAIGIGGSIGGPTPADPWSSRATASPALADPWVPSLHKPATSASPALRMDTWNTRTQSPSITSNSSVENWEAGAGLRSVTTNGNASTVDPWLAKNANPADPWTSNKPADPWSPATSELTKDYGVSCLHKPFSTLIPP